MKISEILDNGKLTLSFEVFPPKTDASFDSVKSAVKKIAELHPSFMSVTYGAGGGTSKYTLDIAKRMHTGILRTARAGWRHGSDWAGSMLITRYSNTTKSKYKTYSSRLDHIVQFPLKNPYTDIQLSRPVRAPDSEKYISHADHRYINNAFKRVKTIYDNLFNKYIKNEVKPDNLNEINSSVAEIRWILAHATPWERGSDAISNTFIRSIYKSIGIKASPLKKGISLDLEAYCTNLEDYKKNFSEYFVKVPYIVE